MVVPLFLVLYLLPANEVWGKVIFSVACVKNSVHRGVCLSACWDTTPLEQTHLPWKQTPPRSRHLEEANTPPEADTPPWKQTPPESRHPPWKQTPTGSRHPLPRKQTLPEAVHAGRYGQQSGGMHPTGMQSCLHADYFLNFLEISFQWQI